MEGVFAGRSQRGLVHTASKATVTASGQRVTAINPGSRSAGKRLERACTAVHGELGRYPVGSESRGQLAAITLEWDPWPWTGLTDSSCPLFVDLMGSVPCTVARLVISILAWPSSPFPHAESC